MDRNIILPKQLNGAPPSLSARRAWIEIFYFADRDCDWVVALRKESVDRNVNIRNPATTLPRSLSARRAWIEMSIFRLALAS